MIQFHQLILQLLLLLVYLHLNKKKLSLEFHLEKMFYNHLLLHLIHLLLRPRRPLLLNNLMILNIELEPTFRSSRH
jgi:hypothetical protein